MTQWICFVAFLACTSAYAGDDHGAKVVDPLETKRQERFQQAQKDLNTLGQKLDTLIAKAGALKIEGSKGDGFNAKVSAYYQAHAALEDRLVKWDQKEDNLKVIEDTAKILTESYGAVEKAYEALGGQKSP